MLTRIRPRPLVALFRRDLPGPVDVVNLIHTERFALYRWYALFVYPVMALVGARPLWMGTFERSLHGEQQADKFLVVRYASQRHFLAMTVNPYYLAINRLREAGVRRFEAAFTHASHTDAGLSRRRLLVAVHFTSPAGENALDAVTGLLAPVAGEPVYATRTVSGLGFLDPPAATDPEPLAFGELALFAVDADDPVADTALAALTAKLATVTAGFSLQLYRREPSSAYLPSLPAGRRVVAAAAVLLACAAGVVAAPAQAQQPAIPIPGPLSGPLPVFTGAPARPQPLVGPYPPANPALAPDGRSGSGLSSANGGTSPFAGPLGNGTTSESSVGFGTCASLAFDAKARLLAVCNGVVGPALRLFDPDTLATLSSLNLPPRTGPDRTDLAGGTHFVVRADGTLLVPTNGRTLITVAIDGNALKQTGSVSLAGLLADGERPFAVGAGYDGRDWVVGNAGTVLTLPRTGTGGEARKLALGEPVAEDIATDPSGTYVVSRDAVYRLVAGADGTPRRIWRQPLLSGLTDGKAGRVHPGPGTPPVIVAGGYVAVADGLNPPRVNVMRIAGRSSRRLACAVPVFKAGKGSVEAHLVAAGRSIVAANAYGYENPATTELGGTTVGGLARVVVGKRGCRTAWTSKEISPSAQAVVSRATGLLYTLTKPAGFPDAWNLTAIDWRTGETRFAALAGEGLGHNSEGAAVVLAPDGSAFAGSFAGVTRFRDAR